jgi:peptidoglycan/LPS O-acetylase OafA/YrhL
VLAVVAFHAAVPGVGGGYVGVDVFFVISGFLITGLLWRELAGTGRLDLVGFYARRARRLLPASVFVLLVTTLACVHYLPPLRARSVLTDALAATLYVGNYRLAAQGTDYLSASQPPSPLQHYWSLGVEEQFYLLWPLLLVLAGVLAGRRGALAALASVGIASFALSLHWTELLPAWAYFSLPSRGWELAAGGVVALLEPWLAKMWPALAGLFGGVGLAAILGSSVLLGSTTAFPGTAALWPVAGAAAVIIAGIAAPGALGQRLLAIPVLQAVGRWSYSWYLWHWPVLLLAPVVIGHPLGLPARLTAAAVSLGLAVLTYGLLENPIHHSRARLVRGRGGLALAGVLACTSLLALGGLAVLTPSPHGHGLASAPVALLPRSQPIEHRAGTAAAPSPLSVLTGQVQLALTRAEAVHQVPANLTPGISGAAGDKAAPFVDGCLSSWTDPEPADCFYADRQASRTVLLLGDSHAAQWQPALDTVAASRRLRLQVLGKSACPPLPIPVFSPYLGRDYTECGTWLNQALATIRSERPALVVLDVARHYGDVYHFTVYSQQWNEALGQVVADIRAAGSQAVVLGPIPKPPADVPTCLSAHLSDATACTLVQAQTLSAAGISGERAAVAAAGGSYLDLSPFLCAHQRCPVVVGNDLVYRDDNHLSTTFAGWLAPVLGLVVDARLVAAHAH